MLLQSAVLVAMLGFASADACAEDAFDVRQAIQKARALRAAGDLEAAAALFRRVIGATQQPRRRALDLEIQARVGLSIVYAERYDYVALRDETAAVLALELTLGRYDDAAISRTDLGNHESKLGNHERAIELLQAAREHFEKVRDVAALAEVDARIAMAMLEVGRHADAIDHGERAAQAFEKAGNGRSLAETLNVLGSVYRDLGSFEIARATLKRALAELPADAVALRASVEVNFGTLEYEAGDDEAGLERLTAASAVLEELGDRLSLSRTRVQIGMAHFRAERFGAAAKVLTKVIEGKDAVAWDVARACVYRGQAHLAIGARAEARADLEHARDLGAKLHNLNVPAAAHAGLAHLLLAEGKPEAALVEVAAARRILGQALGGLAPLTLAVARGHVDRRGAFEAGIQAAQSLRRADLVYEMVEGARATALRRQQVEPRAWGARADPAQLERIQRGRERVVAARLRYDVAVRRERLQAMRAASGELSDALAAQARQLDRLYGFPVPGKSDVRSPIAPVETVRKALRPGEVLCLYSLTGPRGCAVLVRSGGLELVDLGPAEILRKALVKPGGVARIAADWVEEAPSLRAMFAGPLGLTANDTRLIVVPDDGLARVPLLFLFPERAAVFVPSAMVYVGLREVDSESGTGVLAFADPHYKRAHRGRSLAVRVGRRGLEPLPGTRKEIAPLRGEDVTRRVGPDATETEFRRIARTRPRWRLIHLGCHGLPDERRAGRSALALTPSEQDDGFLTAQEILADRFAADLVVLSACRTARGPIVPGEGLMGLPHAFLYRGAQRVVVSHWSVEDKASAALMEAFYEYRKAGNCVHAALRKAQAEVRKQPKWKDAEYWAAWDVWGLLD